MKYHKSGEYMICSHCFDVQQGELQDSLTEMLRKERAEMRRMEEPIHVARLIKYKCGSCGYSFTRKQGFPVQNCPYCSHSELSSFITPLFQ